MVVGFVSGVGTNFTGDSNSRTFALVANVCRGTSVERPFVCRGTPADGRWDKVGAAMFADVSRLPADTGVGIIALGI
jgi:hypothetical protein